MTRVYLVRHGKAGDRSRWDGADDLRPLTKPGRRQADAIAELLADSGIERIVSSGFVRCRQTVEPLAERLRVPVDLSDALAEGAPFVDTLALIDKISLAPAALCSHGDVIGNVIEYLMSNRIPVGSDLRIEKGSIWELRIKKASIIEARYIPASQ